ncbi:MAG: protein translocase subunit SecD [Gammaproteobacteria bacterium]|nr:protein translocase subunit SecD [Gammaproteobacteria bacterium]MDX5374830.1 protein translocase subunit SecD [Gammaproteobacteria bacterium]
MNRYPLWKYLLILAVVIGGILYALPNRYPQDPALQISATRGVEINETVSQRVANVLDQVGANYKEIALEGEQLLVRFDDVEDQLKAQDIVRGVLGSGYIVALNLAPSTPEWLQSLNAKPMNLGLDLRGGVHFLMQVDMDEVVAKTLERNEGEFRSLLIENNIPYDDVSRNESRVVASFASAELRERALTALQEEYRQEMAFETVEADGAFRLEAAIRDEALQEIKAFAVQQNVTALRKRVNELGVAEPLIQQAGEDRVVVQLPGVQDTARAKEILGKTATLEFRLVDENADAYAAQASGRVPPGDRLYLDRQGQPILLKRRVMLTGDYIIDAQSGIDQDSGGPSVSITLDGKGARLFSKASGENVKRLMAVVFIETRTETRIIDGERVNVPSKVEEVINVARIQEQLGKRFQITGLDSSREAADLSLLLRAGALAAPMQIVEERTIGPSLGKDNIEKGFKSVVIGFVLVMVFMALFYRVFGLIANLALTANLLLIVAALSLFQATLTLPGIAGIVLTVGMAVDANVLIFERIREELRNGMSPQAAIRAGYDKALSTIADANITTLIAAVALIVIGTGPVQGFAVTLSIGIVSSMFTAIMGTRAVVNLIYGNRRLTRLAI